MSLDDFSWSRTCFCSSSHEKENQLSNALIQLIALETDLWSTLSRRAIELQVNPSSLSCNAFSAIF